MANPMRGEIPFEADGASYRLSFSVNALCELEDHLSQGITQIIAMLQDPDKLRLSQVRAVFWAGLRDHHNDVDLGAAGDLMTAMGNVVAIDLIGKAFALSFPSSGPTDGPLGKAARRSAGTGKRS
jgi:hypothetical protein